MNEDKITADLRELFENEVRSSPAEHPEKTSRCLPISGFSESAQKAWTDGDRDHVSGCSFCRKTLVYHWERHAPQLWGLAQFLAEVHPQSEAMQLYLERNAEVRRTLDNSLLVRSIAAAIRSVKGLSTMTRLQTPAFGSGDRFGLNQAAFALSRGRSTDLAPSVDELERMRNQAERVMVSVSEEGSSPSELSVSSGDRSLTVRVSAAGEEWIEIRAISPSADYAGRQVTVELLPETGEPIRTELWMNADGEMAGATARVSVSNAERVLDDAVLVAAWG